jgi:hypothetical protein
MSIARPHKVEVTLTDDELARLDEMRPRGVPRAAYLRRLLHEPPKEAEVASRGEALSILTSLAREGRVAAAQALARELREEGRTADEYYIFGD